MGRVRYGGRKKKRKKRREEEAKIDEAERKQNIIGDATEHACLVPVTPCLVGVC